MELNEYIRRDLASLHGIDHSELERLDQVREEHRSSMHRKWKQYADQAALSITDWAISNAPEAIPHLRAAGLTIWREADGFGTPNTMPQTATGERSSV